ncbi:hypothetical protein SAMN04487948_1474 [Halogranum amylolyticum]|uniref:Sulfatase n=1 Tax=Halogranum amylolyticum TaxID=660520 RepID=A0A1H8WVT4_9EURY|nr:hypothetical protein [Halogranum amylolyticum]SEP31775.1 hypothetical protein SAMN04487948_1474 [Halogranum amylolyticum]
MYDADAVKTALKRPNLALTELNRLYYTRGQTREYNPNGTDIFNEDWDNLIILDACRFDIFEEYLPLDSFTGSLEYRISRGSATREWIRGNFTNRDLYDTVYIDSNGYYARLKDEIEAEVYKYNLVENDAFGGISASPEIVTEAAINAANEYPHKRLLIQYMQPHQPFFGPTGENINYKDKFPKTVSENNLDADTLFQAYRENLEIALNSVLDLINKLDGKTVISSDHGELLGESQSPLPATYYGHPAGLYVPTLVRVPWFVIDSEDRRRIRGGTPEQDEVGLDSKEIDEKLRGLGYKI